MGQVRHRGGAEDLGLHHGGAHGFERVTGASDFGFTHTKLRAQAVDAVVEAAQAFAQFGQRMHILVEFFLGLDHRLPEFVTPRIRAGDFVTTRRQTVFNVGEGFFEAAPFSFERCHTLTDRHLLGACVADAAHLAFGFAACTVQPGQNGTQRLLRFDLSRLV